ncbi:hypothetical protein [Novosphingobium acidiphilum]|uniref:hypothetical protein n=1 Tax=Novosphingobium acidiphilum TaxID=505248 RepID=UPI0012EB2ADD|nr:hypothetical protein [Novosphingobium acidiphilum]
MTDNAKSENARRLYKKYVFFLIQGFPVYESPVKVCALVGDGVGCCVCDAIVSGDGAKRYHQVDSGKNECHAGKPGEIGAIQ